jgi:ubiquinone/menaquinone biosynthesis C-methylase UbiE
VDASPNPPPSADQAPSSTPSIRARIPAHRDSEGQSNVAAPDPTRTRHEHFKHTARTHFDRWAVNYDRSWLSELVFNPSMRACHEEILRWQANRDSAAYRLLDVGCGTGNLLLSLAADPQAEELVGLDYSEEMVRRVAAKIGAARIEATSAEPAKQSDRLRVVHGDAEHLPFEDASFDVVACCNSFHHYPHQGTVIRGFHRVLRPGGLLVLIDGFRDNVVGWLVFDVAVKLVEKAVHHASWSAVRAMLTESGFSAVAQRKLNVLAPLLVSTARK